MLIIVSILEVKGQIAWQEPQHPTRGGPTRTLVDAITAVDVNDDASRMLDESPTY
jgi:hypothetical protein